MNTFSKFKIAIVFCLLFSFSNNLLAYFPPADNEKRTPKPTYNVDLREDCQTSEKQIDQQINNVRSRLLSGGDCWWDPTSSEAKYIVPKTLPGEPEVSSIFAGAVWLGGLDPVGNLKLAAVNYRTGGTDFYSGPIDPLTGITDAPVCEQWDRFFNVYSTEVDEIIQKWDLAQAAGESLDCDSIPENVKNWPGKGNPYFLEAFEFELPNTGQGLGSFWDEDGDGDYDPCKGDFPTIDIRGCEPFNREQARELVPDEMIFWIYNDIGGPHTLSEGAPIQMEVQVQAFAFASNDQINDMTFQRYKLINRATSDIRNCYFAMWVDADLGCSTDDFIGCDVGRSLGYYYNQDAEDGDNGCSCDEGANTYCDEIPALGVDYFRGPLSPQVITNNAFSGSEHVIKQSDDIFNFDYSVGDTIFIRDFSVNDVGVLEADLAIELGMSSFTYHNRGGVGNPPPATTDPNIDVEFYNLLQGLWRDGTAVTFGDDGFTPGSRDTVKYTFPNAPTENGGWSMCEESLPQGDRRTLQATGPFLLQPQAVNELIVGVVWAPDFNYPCPDLTRLFFADDIAQALFDNCFKIKDGPDAPDVDLVELDREIILILTNDTITSNNANEQYIEKDLKPVAEGYDDNYIFEGYQIYQLATNNVSVQELDDVTKARLVEQVDIKNDISTLFNWAPAIEDPSGLDVTVWEASKKVEGRNEGVKHTFSVKEDLFADGDTRLVNHKQYYFLVLAYAHNNWEEFDFAFDNGNGFGQSSPYCAGRRNIKVTTAVPRPIVYQNINANYGDGVQITRISGVGTGENFLDVTDESVAEILAGTNEGRITYKEGAAPIDVQIYNPLEVVDGKYRLEILGNHSEGSDCSIDPGASWKLTNLETNEVINSTNDIDIFNEQLVNAYGFSVGLGQIPEAGTTLDKTNGIIGNSFSYPSGNQPNWLGIIGDGFNVGPISEGVFNYVPTSIGESFDALDPQEAYSDLSNRGGFVPFFMTDFTQSSPSVGPGWKDSNGGSGLRSRTNLADLNNVDVVLTSDKSMWSRCIVVESSTRAFSDSGYENIGGARQFELRASPSVGKEADGSGKPIADGDGDGMGWFPGYAIDVETGKRLNIFFGENSYYNESNKEFLRDSVAIGADMMWNPSSDIFVPGDPARGLTSWNFVAGGQHYIYVTRTEYDECAALREEIDAARIPTLKRDALKLVTWAGYPIRVFDLEGNVTPMLSYNDGLIPNDVKIQLRVNNPFNKETLSDFDTNLNTCNAEGELPVYEFEISGKGATAIASDQLSDALANASVVPNPYYGFSDYETNRLDQAIKITNIPDRANVTIYSMDGKFIRQFKRDEQASRVRGSNRGIANSQTNPDLDWDLKNSAGIPIASGVYLFHIQDLDTGEETTVKWFGINRKFDPSGL